MSNLIDAVSDLIFLLAEQFIDPDRPRRTIGTLSVAMAVFCVIGTVIATTLGKELDWPGTLIVALLVFFTATVAIYCFFTDRSG